MLVEFEHTSMVLTSTNKIWTFWKKKLFFFFFLRRNCRWNNCLMLNLIGRLLSFSVPDITLVRQVYRLKVAPNVAHPISLKDSDALRMSNQIFLLTKKMYLLSNSCDLLGIKTSGGVFDHGCFSLLDYSIFGLYFTLQEEFLFSLCSENLKLISHSQLLTVPPPPHRGRKAKVFKCFMPENHGTYPCAENQRKMIWISLDPNLSFHLFWISLFLAALNCLNLWSHFWWAFL